MKISRLCYTDGATDEEEEEEEEADNPANVK